MTYAYELYFSAYIATRMDTFTENMRLIRIYKCMFGSFGGHIMHLVISLLQSQITHHKLHIASIKLTPPKMYFRATIVA